MNQSFTKNKAVMNGKTVQTYEQISQPRFTTLLVLIFAGTNFRGDRIDHILRVLIFANLPNQVISRALIFCGL